MFNFYLVKQIVKLKLIEKVINKFKKDFKSLSGKRLSKMQECVLADTLDFSQGDVKKLGQFFPKQKIDNQKNTIKYLKIKDKIINYLEKKNK